ncbi:MAG: DUF2892 domain-containing protein [Opitutus sp.]|nr:DUF2892 domain-containing protein [Opitutus sp.]
MKHNVGSADCTLRVVLGLAILLGGISVQSWWGLVGLLPLISGLVRYCPVYPLFGFNTVDPREE